MGCSAGKTISTSPEISTSTQHTNLAGANTKLGDKNGLFNNGLADDKQSSKTINSPKASVNTAFRKDSTSSTHSCNSLDITEEALEMLPNSKQTTQPNTKEDQDQPQCIEEKENGSLPKKLVYTKDRSEGEKPSVKSIPLGQIKVQMTQSQADFFTMLDRKIEEGQDYRSDCER